MQPSAGCGHEHAGFARIAEEEPDRTARSVEEHDWFGLFAEIWEVKGSTFGSARPLCDRYPAGAVERPEAAWWEDDVIDRDVAHEMSGSSELGSRTERRRPSSSSNGSVNTEWT